MTSAADIAKIGSGIVEGVIDHEGLINMIATAAGIMPAVALAEKALPLIAAALNFMAQEAGKSPMDVFGDLVKHLTPGAPNAPALAEGKSTPGE